MSKEEFSKYLNEIKTRVDYDIDLQLENIESKIYESKQGLQFSNESIYETKKKINEIELKLKQMKRDNNKMDAFLWDEYHELENEKEELEKEIECDDKSVDELGDSKTSHEKTKLEFSSFKLKCNELIETIDLYLEVSDDEENQKKEIQDMVKTLIKQYKTLKFEPAIMELIKERGLIGLESKENSN